MEHINYEERYPTHISHAFPEPQSPEPLEEQVKASPPPMSPPGDRLSATVTASPFQPYNEEQAVEQTPNNPQPPPPRLILGMSKTVFFLSLALLILVIGGIIGGAVGGTLGKKNNSTVQVEGCISSASCTPNSATISTLLTPTSTSSHSVSSSDSSATTSISPTPTQVTTGQIASSTFTNSSTWVYNYYQKGSDIFYTLYPGGSGFSSPKVLSLNAIPKAGTPLAATSIDNGDGSATLDLFYLDSSNNIIHASLTISKSSTDIGFKSNEIIQSGTNVHPSSSLAAIYMSASYGYRVYYQNTQGRISELVGQNAAWSSGTILTITGISGTAISVAQIFVPNLNVFYIDSASSSIYCISFTNRNGWAAAKQLIPSASLSSWQGNSSVSLAAIAQTKPNTLRVYYVGTDNQFYETGCSTNDAWNCASSKPDYSASWTTSDGMGPGAVGAIGWSDQVRFYYFHLGHVVQAALSGTNWGTAVIPDT